MEKLSKDSPKIGIQQLNMLNLSLTNGLLKEEFKKWQQLTQEVAMASGLTHTLLGRSRNLSKFLNTKQLQKNGLRAAINTPIQGGAADIVIEAMVKLYHNKRLAELGWKQILQIHDEVIFEVPEESADEALEIVKDVMEHPLDFPLLVDLEVSAHIANNWFKGK